jgi:hypothetical protein
MKISRLAPVAPIANRWLMPSAHRPLQPAPCLTTTHRWQKRRAGARRHRVGSLGCRMVPGIPPAATTTAATATTATPLTRAPIPAKTDSQRLRIRHRLRRGLRGDPRAPPHRRLLQPPGRGSRPRRRPRRRSRPPPGPRRQISRPCPRPSSRPGGAPSPRNHRRDRRRIKRTPGSRGHPPPPPTTFRWGEPPRTPRAAPAVWITRGPRLTTGARHAGAVEDPRARSRLMQPRGLMEDSRRGC